MTRKSAIKPEDLQITYSRSANLKDYLVKGELERNRILVGTYPCGKIRCKTCAHITTTSVVKKDNKKYKTQGHYTCQSSNLVYLLTCSICQSKYIGETENTLNTRCRGHETNMRSYNDNLVSRHFKSYNHTFDDYSILVLQPETDKNKRLRLEEAWMILLDTLTPNGLNSRW